MNPITVEKVLRTMRSMEANPAFKAWLDEPRDTRQGIACREGTVYIHNILTIYHWARQRLIPTTAPKGSADSAAAAPLPKGRWRIVEGDNFGGDYPNEQFVNVPATTQAKAKMIADAINAAFCDHDHATRYWRAVPEDYTLQPGFEP